MAFKVGEKEVVGKSAPPSNQNISVVRDFSNLARLVAEMLLVCKLVPAQFWVGNDEKPAVAPGTKLRRSNVSVCLSQGWF